MQIMNKKEVNVWWFSKEIPPEQKHLYTWNYPAGTQQKTCILLEFLKKILDHLRKRKKKRPDSFSFGTYFVNVIVHLVCHFLELVVGHAEVSLVWVEVGVLPATLSLSLIHIRGQVEGGLDRLTNEKKGKICFSCEIRRPPLILTNMYFTGSSYNWQCDSLNRDCLQGWTYRELILKSAASLRFSELQGEFQLIGVEHLAI